MQQDASEAYAWDAATPRGTKTCDADGLDASTASLEILGAILGSLLFLGGSHHDENAFGNAASGCRVL
jgi:hypothetical protein